MKQFDTVVFIGRFQPLHNAHVEIIKQACSIAREVIIIVGSINQPKTFKNPWSFEERRMMLNNTLNTLDIGTTRVHIAGNTDSIYNDNAWAARVQAIVSSTRCVHGSTAIIGHKKDSSSFYLDMFPQWEYVEVDSLADNISATDIREVYFVRNKWKCFSIEGHIPEPVYNMLLGMQESPDFIAICNEKDFITKYKEQYKNYPYPPIFVTADALVVCCGHILLVKRAAYPGKGLWALPGGFLNANTDKSVKVAMLRELREETGIKVPEPVLAGSVVRSEVFDAVDRSSRGRTITHAFYILLNTLELPKVKGSDDAEKAVWVPLSEVRSDKFFEDHFEIISMMVGL